MMKKTYLTGLIILLFAVLGFSQEQPIEKPAKGYRFQHRIKGPMHKKSKILELAVDEHGNYLVTTFRGEKSSFVYLIIYNLYTWDEKYKLKLDDNRCELYNSFFSEDGEYIYINTDVYRNMYKKVNLKTGEIIKVSCEETPKGCRKIEPEFYKLDAYTVGENYYIHRDEKFQNYIRILVKKEMYIPKDASEFDDWGGGDWADLDPSKGGVIQLTPAEIRELKSGNEFVYKGITLFYDPNSLDDEGKPIPYSQADGEPFKVRLTPLDISKLEQKASFLIGKFVLKLDLDAWEAEQKGM